MKLLKNKFFVAVVAAALILSIVPTVLALTGHKDFLRSGLVAVSYPFRAAFGFAADGISGFARYFSGMNGLIKENEALKEELDSYRDAAARAESAEGELRRLREYYDFVASHTTYTMTDARVTGRQSNSYSVIYTLNRGSECGIKVNMGVVTTRGVVGYITEVGVGWSRAVALTDPTAAVGVYEPSTGLYGTLEGSVAHRQDGLCLLPRVPADVTMKEGDKLLTSGGRVFPPDIEVGRIVSSEPDAYTHTSSYLVEPSVDFDGVTSVIIITGLSSEAG